jgi:hypothetical protein
LRIRIGVFAAAIVAAAAIRRIVGADVWIAGVVHRGLKRIAGARLALGLLLRADGEKRLGFVGGHRGIVGEMRGEFLPLLRLVAAHDRRPALGLGLVVRGDGDRHCGRDRLADDLGNLFSRHGYGRCPTAIVLLRRGRHVSTSGFASKESRNRLGRRLNGINEAVFQGIDRVETPALHRPNITVTDATIARHRLEKRRSVVVDVGLYRLFCGV